MAIPNVAMDLESTMQQLLAFARHIVEWDRYRQLHSPLLQMSSPVLPGLHASISSVPLSTNLQDSPKIGSAVAPSLLPNPSASFPSLDITRSNPRHSAVTSQHLSPHYLPSLIQVTESPSIAVVHSVAKQQDLHNIVSPGSSVAQDIPHPHTSRSPMHQQPATALSHHTSTYAQKVPENISAASKPLVSHTNPNPSGFRSSQKIAQLHKLSQQSTIVCFRCGDRDHKASVCRNSVLCFECGRLRHRSHQC